MTRQPKTNRNRRNHKAFTLIELLVVIVIIGVLAGTVGLNLLSRVGDSRVAKAKSSADQIVSAVEMFLLDHTAAMGGETMELSFLVERPSFVDQANWQPYIANAERLNDPWGNRFIIRMPGEVNARYDIISYGADGQPGGEGENADIIAGS